MSFSGNLRTMPFADLLQWVAQSRKTGTLVIAGNQHQKKVYFNDGLVVAVSSDSPREYLGYYLVGWNLVAEEDLQELLDMQSRYGTLLGELLVIVGRISREMLTYVLEVKTEEAIYELFTWPEGDFSFLEKILPDKRFQPADLPVDTLILEGLRRKDEWELIKEKITSIHMQPKLIRAVNVQQVDETELAILREINGRTSIEQIAMSCRLSCFAVVEYIYHGVEAGLFEVIQPENEPETIPGYSKGVWKLTLQKAESLLEQGETRQCYEQLAKLRKDMAKDRDALEAIDKVEQQLRHEMEESGITGDAVLELLIPMAQLTTLSCSPEEGFFLSRVNGSYRLDEICKMIPGDRLQIHLTVDTMLRRKVLGLKKGRR